MQVGAVALEKRMRRDREEDVEVALRAAAQARFAFAGQPDARAVLDAGRHVDRKRALARDAARARAVRAWIVDHLAAALAGDAGALEREEALRVAHLAGALAGRAGLWLGAGLGARAGARLAGDRGRDAHLRGLAGERLLERDLHVVAQIRAALASAAAPPPAAHPEQVFEDVREARGEVRAEAVRRPAARSEEHTSELQSRGLISYAVFCLKKKNKTKSSKRKIRTWRAHAASRLSRALPQ